MPRYLYIYDPDTGKRFDERNVTDLSEHEVTINEFEMRCKWDLYGIFIDTAKDVEQTQWAQG